MDLRRILRDLADVVADEAAINPSFRERIEAAIGIEHAESNSKPPLRRARGLLSAIRPLESGNDSDRRKGRRTPAVLDPVDIARNSEVDLRSRLAELDLERLLDIVAQYGMDPGKLVMKWKDRERVIDKIVETSISRATKGDAFRRD